MRQAAPMPAVLEAPPAVRVTQCPGYTTDLRYAVALPAHGFAALGIGRYAAGPRSCAAKAIA